MENPIPNPVRGLLIGGWVSLLIWLERKRSLRAVHESKLIRDGRNLAVAAAAGAVMQFAEMPVAFGLARSAVRKKRGVLNRLPVPRFVRGILGILALDYTLYWWHYLTHRIPLLWRFHAVHHIDREMDATTALRFHFGEIAISVVFRAGQIVTIGPSPFTVALWQVLLFLSILFHHSNVRLPLQWERRLARFVMTPRLHGIHHSVRPGEVNSNWSSGLTAWDWLHRTLRTVVDGNPPVLGVPDFRSDRDTRLDRLLVLPWIAQPQVPPYAGKPVREPFAKLT